MTLDTSMRSAGGARVSEVSDYDSVRLRQCPITTDATTDRSVICLPQRGRTEMRPLPTKTTGPIRMAAIGRHRTIDGRADPEPKKASVKRNGVPVPIPPLTETEPFAATAVILSLKWFGFVTFN